MTDVLIILASMGAFLLSLAIVGVTFVAIVYTVTRGRGS